MEEACYPTHHHQHLPLSLSITTILYSSVRREVVELGCLVLQRCHRIVEVPRRVIPVMDRGTRVLLVVMFIEEDWRLLVYDMEEGITIALDRLHPMGLRAHLCLELDHHWEAPTLTTSRLLPHRLQHLSRVCRDDIQHRGMDRVRLSRKA